jgi:hypothetical protein
MSAFDLPHLYALALQGLFLVASFPAFPRAEVRVRKLCCVEYCFIPSQGRKLLADAVPCMKGLVSRLIALTKMVGNSAKAFCFFFFFHE